MLNQEEEADPAGIPRAAARKGELSPKVNAGVRELGDFGCFLRGLRLLLSEFLFQFGDACLHLLQDNLMSFEECIV